MKNRIGIHLRLLLGVFAIIGITTFLLGYVGVNLTKQFVHDRFEDRISYLARYLALNAELGILIGDKTMLERLAYNLMTANDVGKVAIIDREGTELASVFKDLPGPFSVVETPVLPGESGSENRLFDLFERGLRIEDPIGTIQITYSTWDLERLLTTIENRFVWLSSGLAFFAALVFYFLSRSLVAPVMQLAEAAGQVEQGNLDTRVVPCGPPETRRLATSFNSMLISLEKNRKALEDVYQELMKQNALAEMGKFSMMIAHEVKNPLGIIKSSLDILKKDCDLSSGETMVYYMEDEIKRLNRLIEDFLAFAQPARPSFCPVDLNALLSEIVMKFQMQEGRSSVEIKPHIPREPFETDADPDLITRAISNILRNALEANGGKGIVRVSVFCGNLTWKMDIEDEGEGIDPDKKEKIFEPFYTTRSKGTGLGLAYVFQVIMSHSGNVWVENREHGGAVFSVELPIRKIRKGETDGSYSHR